MGYKDRFIDDDGVTVTDYPEDDTDIHPKSNYLDSIVDDFFDVIGTHGWIILGTLLILIYVWTKYIQQYIFLWLRNREDKQFEAKHHKDPDSLKKEKEKLEQARLRLQKKYEEEAELYKEKMKEKEALKKQKEAAARQSDGVHLGDGSDDSNSGKKNYKPVYNPLTGASSLPSYRPPRRTACSRGNCG